MQIEITKDVKKRMCKHLRTSGNREIGGVLMAEQLKAGHFKIVDFSVDEQTGSVAHFVRSPEHHRKALGEFFERTNSNYERYNYLGEWHSHPSFSVQPSTADLASMCSLVRGERGIHFAALMIVRLKWWVHLEYSISVFTRGEENESGEQYA